MAQNLRDDLVRAGMLPDYLSPAPKVADQLGVSRRTLSRWIIDEQLGFPSPVEINKRLYFKQHEIDAWTVSRAVRSVREAA